MKRMIIFLMVSFLVFSFNGLLFANDEPFGKPSAGGFLGDALWVRPIGSVQTAFGATSFVTCAAVTEGPEGRSFSFGGREPYGGTEIRLLSMDILQSGNLSANTEYWAMIKFESAPKPDIRRACFNFSGDGQSCVDVQANDVTYGLHPHFRVRVHVPVGSKRIDCYAEYIREGETHRTNAVTYYVIALKKPEE